MTINLIPSGTRTRPRPKHAGFSDEESRKGLEEARPAAVERLHRALRSPPVSRLWNPVILGLALVVGCGASDGRLASGREPVVGGPCEGCEAVFQGLPAELSAVARIAPPGEPGEPLRVEGRVTDRDGAAAPGTIVYAYQTNAAGIYPRDASLQGRAAQRHGLLRGWAQADADGRYRFDTVRPGGYPDSDMPQHIHLHVIELGRCTYYLDDIVFTDDPRLTPDKIRQYSRGRGGRGVVSPRQGPEGTWLVERDIELGAGIPDYSRCGRADDPAAKTPPRR